MAQFGKFVVPEPYNEPCYDYEPGSERARLVKEACERVRKNLPFEVPIIVNGKEIKTGSLGTQLICSDNKVTLCKFHQATKEIIQEAIEGALEAKKKWEELSFEARATIFLKAADLISGKYRYELLAACMLGQGKNVWQAEIDVIAEACDFLRFNVKYAEEIYSRQPKINPKGVWNRVEYRPLEGYVTAITPFNFSAIGINLPTAPAIVGNVVLWKPASTAVYSNYLMYKILQEAGLPDGVIQFVPGSGRVIGNALINHEMCAGVHFTGSTRVFKQLWLQTAKNTMSLYKSYPRVVGETGGKNFHIIHPSYTEYDSIINNSIRAAFEYQGQKCSALSRMYVPRSTWEKIKDKLVSEVKKIKMGQADDLSVFMTAVIDEASFNNIKGYIERAEKDDDVEILVGGGCDSSKGWFVEPTILVTKNPKSETMVEEIFGPVLTVYVYEDDDFIDVLKLADGTSQYGLTGSIFCKDKYALEEALKILRYAAGNFYINDKCTGSIVGQQPFGGARASGNNQKAGATDNLTRWLSPRSIKETFVTLNHWSYPHMGKQ